MTRRGPARRRKRRRRLPASAPRARPVSSGPRETSAGALEAGPPSERPRGPRVSSAALVAFLLCLWGQSLLLFEWARTDVFGSEEGAHLLLVTPFFGGAVVAALVAVVLRARGRRGVGGPLVHGLGLASGLLGATALVLVLWLGPRVRAEGEQEREARAARQLEVVAMALDLHRRVRGTYPVGAGIETVAAALAPELLSESLPLKDPWGQDLRYRSFGAGDGYLLLSTGYDGAQDLPDRSYLVAPSERRPTNDLAFCSGRLVAAGRLGLIRAALPPVEGDLVLDASTAPGPDMP